LPPGSHRWFGNRQDTGSASAKGPRIQSKHQVQESRGDSLEPIRSAWGSYAGRENRAWCGRGSTEL